jgi:hypothetical protein
VRHILWDRICRIAVHSEFCKLIFVLCGWFVAGKLALRQLFFRVFRLPLSASFLQQSSHTFITLAVDIVFKWRPQNYVYPVFSAADRGSVMFAIAVSPVRYPSVGDRFITAQRRRRSASRLCPDRESSLVFLLVWSKVFRTITNDTCDTLKHSGKYTHHFLYFSLILCLCLLCDRWDGHWKRNSSCLNLKLFLFITKQQLFDSQIIPVYHETAAVW